ncbi:hypothetical protein D9V84_10745, partial [Bacteroidetes/Chlorobi group bacterium Naka2016]
MNGNQKKAIRYESNIGKGVGKTLSPVFLLLILSIFQTRALDFEFTPLHLTFGSPTICKEKILIPANFGTILYTSDFGKTWNYKSIGDFTQIWNIINYEDTLWGICDDNSVIISTDCGQNWTKKKIQLDTNENLVNIFVDAEGIYIRTDQSIALFDRNLQQVTKVSKPFLKLSKSLYLERSIPFKIEYYPGIFKNIYSVFNKIVLAVANDSSIMVVFDKNLKNYFLVKRDEINGGWNILLNNILFIDKKPIASMGYILYNLYYFDSTFKNFTYFFPDTTFMNYADTLNSAEELTIGIPSTYFTVDDSLYILSSVEPDSVFIGTKYSINKINKYVPEDIKFRTVGEFIDNYNSLLYMKNTGSNSGYNIFGVSYLFTMGSPPNVLNDSIIVKTNFKRFLSLSTDKGRNWSLKSFLGGKPRFILNDSTYFFINQYLDNTEMAKTTDGGKTFVPAKNFKLGHNKFMVNIDYRTLPLFYVNEKGKGFMKGYQGYSPEYLIYTNDYWDYQDKKYLEDFNLGYESIYPIQQFTSNVIELPDKFFFIKSDTLTNLFDIGYRSFLCLLDTSFNSFSSKKIDTLSAIFYINGNSYEKFIAFCLANNPEDLHDISFEIRSYYLEDNYYRFQILQKLTNYKHITQIYEHNKDSIFVSFKNPNRIYLYERPTNRLQLIWQTEENSYAPLLMVISDRFFIVGRGLFLENTNRNDLTKWREGEWDYGKPNFESVIFKG